MDVEEDELRLLLAHRLNRLLASVHGADEISGAREHLDDERAHVVVVFDDQDRLSTMSVAARHTHPARDYADARYRAMTSRIVWDSRVSRGRRQRARVRAAGSSASVDQSRSRAERIGLPIGHGMARARSSQRIPRSCAGLYSAVVL